MTIFVFQKHALLKRIFICIVWNQLQTEQVWMGHLSHEENQAFVSKNQQENAYNNQIRIIYQDK